VVGVRPTDWVQQVSEIKRQSGEPSSEKRKYLLNQKQRKPERSHSCH
jgi:hypothetical protein